MGRMDAVTVYNGQGAAQAPIALVVQELFAQKWESTQPDYIRVWRNEYMGEKKGNHQRGFLEPSLPNDTDALEAFNNAFKEDGTHREQAPLDGEHGFDALLV